MSFIFVPQLYLENKISVAEKETFKMKNEIQEFVNEELGFKVRCIQNDDGSISMKLNDTAIGYGWTKIANSGNQVIRWSRVEGYLKEFGVTTCGHEDFIPESLFYLLGMKASNDTARKFQMWLATEVIPSIRKHGAFIADSENVDEHYVLNELRFSQKRTIKTFANASAEDIRRLYEEFRAYVDSEFKYRTDVRVARYKSVEKGLQQWLENNASNPSTIGNCYNVRQLTEQVLRDRTTLEKRISGGEKAAKTKRIGELEDTLAELIANPA